MQARLANLITKVLDQLGSLHSISFQLSRSQWNDDEHRVHTIINAAIRRFEIIAPLTGGRHREIQLFFDDGETEVLHVESKGETSRDVD
jgi:hypothetical protein